MIPCTPCFVSFCTVAALAELENLRVGQWMLSRPIVLGPLLGWLRGDVALGARLGAALEILCLEELPLGAVVPLNGTLAVAAAVWLGSLNEAPGAALAAGLLFGWLFRPIESLVRRWTRRYGRDEEAALQGRGLSAPLLRLSGAAAAHYLVVVAFLLAGLSLAERALPHLLNFPGAAGLETALALMPFLGLAALLHALRPRA